MIHLDDAIGQLVETLEAEKLLDETLIVVTSDNGGFPKQGGFNYPFRGTKSSSWEGGIRVPALLFGPEYGFTDMTYDGIVHAVDWSATFLGLIDQTRGEPKT